MAFIAQARGLLYEDVSQADALATWRYAAQRVGECWSQHLSAPRTERRQTFATYVAALDIEAAAAADLAAT